MLPLISPLFLLLSLLLSFFYHEEIYLSKEKQCYLFVMLPCKYKSSTSCKSHSLSCKNLLVSVKSLSQMFMSHIRKCMFRLCVYLLGIYQSFYVHKVFLVCLQLIITDQRDSLNGFANEHWMQHSSDVMDEMMKWKRKKRAICFSFLVLWLFLSFSPLDLFPHGDDNFRHYSIAFILSHHIRAEVSFGWYLIILETMCH